MGNLTAEYRHVPVMLSQVLAELDPKVGEVVCDCTLGGAGHSVELARRIAPEGLLVGIDQDDILTRIDQIVLERSAIHHIVVEIFHSVFSAECEAL